MANGVGMDDLLQSLKHEHALIREAAAETLERLGPNAVSALPALVEAATTDRCSRSSSAAAQAALRIAVPLLKDADPARRTHAAEFLGQLGRKGGPALSVLISCVVSDKDNTSAAAARAAVSEILSAGGVQLGKGVRTIPMERPTGLITSGSKARH